MAGEDYKIMLAKLRQVLYGEMTTIAKANDVSTSSVLRVLRGDYVNKDILNACIKRAEEIKKEKSSIAAQIKQAVK